MNESRRKLIDKPQSISKALTEIKLTLKDGTWKTWCKVILGDRQIEPNPHTRMLILSGRVTCVLTIAVYVVNLSKEAQMCLVALKSTIRKESRKEFRGLGTVQEIPPFKAASEVVATSLVALESCVVSIETRFWYCCAVKPMVPMEGTSETEATSETRFSLNFNSMSLIASKRKN